MSDDVERVASGYNAVYAALPRSPTFERLWRRHACGEDFPQGFEHISFVTRDELHTMRDALALQAGDTLLDLACGMGGPGLWIARETGARYVGLDVSTEALQAARDRAKRVDVRDARFVEAQFSDTGLETGSVDGAMSIDALQYALDKGAALQEFARVLRPGGRLVFACFELDASVVSGLPVLGSDPTDDYAQLLEHAGFDVLRCEETPDWRKRVHDAYQAVLDNRETLTDELGSDAYNALAGEVTLTLQLQPYRGGVCSW